MDIKMNWCKIGLHTWKGNSAARECLKCGKREINYWGDWRRGSENERNKELFESLIKEKDV